MLAHLLCWLSTAACAAIQVQPPAWQDGPAEWHAWRQRKLCSAALLVSAGLQHRHFHQRTTLLFWRFFAARNCKLRSAWVAAIRNREALVLWAAFAALRMAVQMGRRERRLLRRVLRAWRENVAGVKEAQALSWDELAVRDRSLMPEQARIL